MATVSPVPASPASALAGPPASEVHSILHPTVLARVSKELRRILAQPAEGIRLVLNERNLADVQADLDGPVGTPYEGGVFRVKLAIGNEFPSAPPRGVFCTKIFHPNVSTSGEICVNTLKKDWSPDLGLGHVLQVVRCLLIVPFPESALNPEASQLFLDSYQDYFERAKLWTSIHAVAPPAVQEKPSLTRQSSSSSENARLNVNTTANPPVKKSASNRALKRL